MTADPSPLDQKALEAALKVWTHELFDGDGPATFDVILPKAIRAYLTARVPDDVGKVVKRLRELIVSDAFERREIINSKLAERIIHDRNDAVSTIERQADEITRQSDTIKKLEAEAVSLKEKVGRLRAENEILQGYRTDAVNGFVDGIQTMLDGAESARARPVEGMVCVPREPTEAMWGGLARDLMMWLDMNPRPTGRSLYEHLRRLGIQAPMWLHALIGDVDHVPSKGQRVAAIYRAMLESTPSDPLVAGTVIGKKE